LSESGHHYLKKPAYGLVFCFLGFRNSTFRRIHHLPEPLPFKLCFWSRKKINIEISVFRQ